MPEYGESLSQRELEVLQCVAEGAQNKEIASHLSISQNTVKVHLRNIFLKLGVSSRTEATTSAIQRGFVGFPGASRPTPAAPVLGDSDLVSETESASEQPSLQSEASSAAGTSPVQAATPGKQSFWLKYRNPFLLLIALLILVLSGLLWLQQRDEASTTTPERFVATAIGESGWFENRPLPEARANMAVAAVGLNIYQIGGETSAGTVDTVTAYDTTAHSWHEATAKPTAVSDITAAVLFGEIYVPGGRLANGEPTAIVEAYSPTNDAWRPAAALPQPVSGGLTLSDGSFLYLVGGWDGQQYLDTTYVYDVGADSWRPLSPLPHARAFAAGNVVTGLMYVVGGYDGIEELSLCHYLDADVGEWSSCPEMLLPRAAAGAAVVLNKLYVIGGGLDPSNQITFSEVYDPNSSTWQVINTPLLKETPSWSHLGVANVEVRVYALGGRRAEAASLGNYVFAPRVYRTFIPAASTGNDD